MKKIDAYVLVKNSDGYKALHSVYIDKTLAEIKKLNMPKQNLDSRFSYEIESTELYIDEDVNSISSIEYERALDIVKVYQEQQKAKSYAMYEPAGCSFCNRGQLRTGGGSDLSVTYWDRCKCANIKTKRYQEFLDNVDDMLVKDYNVEKEKYFDNNSHIKIGNNMTDRSW